MPSEPLHLLTVDDVEFVDRLTACGTMCGVAARSVGDVGALGAYLAVEPVDQVPRGVRFPGDDGPGIAHPTCWVRG
jgi:hypothetical protein